ncbi:hypothetical protein [Barthadenovirus sternae]|nr:hypothetical protein [Tern atadenovirus 1]
MWCIRSSVLTPAEKFLKILIEKKEQGMLCFKQIINCGCAPTANIERYVCRNGQSVTIYTFSAIKPCCGYVVTCMYEILDEINNNNFDFKVASSNPQVLAAVSIIFILSTY